MRTGENVKPIHLQRCPFCFSETEGELACGCRCQGNEAAFLPVGSILNDRYAVGAMRSFNGFAAEYVCFDTEAGSRVLIKEYCPLLLAERTEGGSMNLAEADNLDPYNAGMQFFQIRAKALSPRSERPVFVPLRETFFENNTAYAVVDFHEGKTLDEALREGSADFSGYARRFASEALKELYAFHREGVIHGNLSAATAFVCEGRLIIDGFAPQNEELSLLTGAALPAAKAYEYLPLSALLSSADQPATDLFAVGAILYSLLTGKKPASPFSAAPRLDSDALAQACSSRQLTDVILNLCGEGKKEYADAAQALADLGVAAEPSPAPGIPRPRRRKRLVAAALLAILALGALILTLRHVSLSHKEQISGTGTDAVDPAEREQAGLTQSAGPDTGEDVRTENLPEPDSAEDTAPEDAAGPDEEGGTATETVTEKNNGHKLEWYSEAEEAPVTRAEKPNAGKKQPDRTAGIR